MNNMTSHQICTKCVMDTTDPDITFDEKGVCNHCKKYKEIERTYFSDPERLKSQFENTINILKKEGKGKEYDCIMGISGGVDSSYVAYLLKQNGVRPLAVHFDGGWNSELAVKNIENIVKKLELDLVTLVCDWEEMKDLQLSFFKASVANCDIPQDHAFVAALYKCATEYGIKYIVSGHNYSTESILPMEWGYTSNDLTHILGIQKKFGTQKIKNYPSYSAFKKYFYYKYITPKKTFNILNSIEYNKAAVKKLLMEKLEWRDYGGKHYESRFTKFFQAHYLPLKFGFDKRKAHLASLIVSNQMTREEALKELEQELYPINELNVDKEFIAKKLSITLDEFDEILERPCKSFRDYSYNKPLYFAREVVHKGFKTALRQIFS